MDSVKINKKNLEWLCEYEIDFKQRILSRIKKEISK